MTFEHFENPAGSSAFKKFPWRIFYQFSPLLILAIVSILFFHAQIAQKIYQWTDIWDFTAAVPSNLPDRSQLDSTEDDDEDYLGYLTRRDYDHLEELFLETRTSGKSTALGQTEEAQYFSSLVDIDNENEATFQSRIRLINDWISEKPTSLPAHVALAKILINYAWFARGSGWGDSVTADGWSNFNARLNKADQALGTVYKDRIISSGWYSAKQTIGMGLQADRATYMKMVSEGSRYMPRELPVYSSALVYLLPRWEGSNTELWSFIERSANSLGGDEGDMLYARLSVSIWSYDYSNNIISEVGLSWPRISRGLTLLYRKYPHSQNLVNYYCALAVMAKDKPVAQVLFKQLGSDKVLFGQGYPWADINAFNRNRTWANS